MKKLSILLTIFALSIITNAQTPGLIIKDAGTGARILDPNGDGYISAKTNGKQLGFTVSPNKVMSQSEIPYASIVKEDSKNDNIQSTSGHASKQYIGAILNQYAAMGYFDGTNVLFRVLVGEHFRGNNGFSILIDTDQKFGFTGTNADRNAVVGNPGFEVEIALMTKNAVNVYNIDGTNKPVLLASNSYQNNVQKSVAISPFRDRDAYYLDFYIPVSQLTAISGLNITTSTPLRFAIVANRDPKPCTGSRSLYDVCGNSNASFLDGRLIDLITNQTPTSLNQLNAGGVLTRSACPQINAVVTSASLISGTSTEATGTSIQVYVYQSDGTTLIGSGTTKTIGSNWNINVNALSPKTTLAVGQIVKATATALGKGVSDNNCDSKVVTNCIIQTKSLSAFEVSKINGDKGYEIACNRPVGTKVFLYNSDYTLKSTSEIKNGVTNPYTTTRNAETFRFECQTGHCFGNDVYSFQVQESGKCLSDFYTSCDYTTGGLSPIPTITSAIITESTTAILGKGTVANAKINLYADDSYIGSSTAGAASPYSFSVPVSELKLGQTITAKQIVSGKCISNKSAGIIVTRPTISPVILTSTCDKYPLTTVTGSSDEAAGTSIALYKTNGTRTAIGSAKVLADGTWTINGLNILAGDSIVANVQAGGVLSKSPDSNIITFSSQTKISDYTITFDSPIIEGQTAISGAISGGTYPDVINTYNDVNLVGTGTATANAGVWIVSGINAPDLSVDDTVRVKITGSGKTESASSDTYAIVQCANPIDKDISAAITNLCEGSNGYITVHNSQVGVYYVPFSIKDNDIFGYGEMGNGGDIVLTTNEIINDITLGVKASKIPLGTCEILLNENINFTTKPRPSSPTGLSPELYCESGTLAELVVTIPSGSTLKWYDALINGNELPLTTNLASGNTYYAESVDNTNACASAIRTSIDVLEGSLTAPVADAAQSACPASTLTDISAELVGPGSLRWFGAAIGGTVLPMSTKLQSGATYYGETFHNSCVSLSRTPVKISYGVLTDSTKWTGAVSNEWNNDANWTNQHPNSCKNVIIPSLSNDVKYPIISEPAACYTITFKSGAGVLGLQHLTYTKAYVQENIERSIWYTLTPPLKNMYAGDYYFQGVPVTYMRFFDGLSADSMNKGVSNVGTWSTAITPQNTVLQKGMGYAYYISTKTFHYPTPITYDTTSTIMCFPRRNVNGTLLTTVYPYNSSTGKLTTTSPIALPRDTATAYRFAMEDANNVLQNGKIAIKQGLNIIGNPYMSHINFNALYASNSTVISNKLKLWNGSTFTTYMAESGIFSSSDFASSSIAPMHAFFVEGITNDSLAINLETDFCAYLGLSPSNVDTTNVLHIQTNNGSQKSGTAIAMRPNASNQFGNEDAFKLLTQIMEVPEVYTVADEIKLDINEFGSLPYMAPIGLTSNLIGDVNFTFDGASSFDNIDVTLMNTRTGEQQNLKANKRYTLPYDGNATDGYLFVEFTEANAPAELRSASTANDSINPQFCNRCIQVYQKGPNLIGIISPENDKIQNITVWEKSGKMLFNSTNVNRSILDVNVNATNQTCVVRVTTQNKSYVIKLLMK